MSDQDELLLEVAKTKDRNKPCPCGSGHKFKKCCGFVWTAAQQKRRAEQWAARRAERASLQLSALPEHIHLSLATCGGDAGALESSYYEILDNNH